MPNHFEAKVPHHWHFWECKFQEVKDLGKWQAARVTNMELTTFAPMSESPWNERSTIQLGLGLGILVGLSPGCCLPIVPFWLS